MSATVLIKNSDGVERAVYSVDAREMLSRPGNDWTVVRRLEASARIIEPGVAAEAIPGATDGAVEFRGEAVSSAAAQAALAPPTKPAPINFNAPVAPEGSRGGGPQEPAAPSEEK